MSFLEKHDQKSKCAKYSINMQQDGKMGKVASGSTECSTIPGMSSFDQA